MRFPPRDLSRMRRVKRGAAFVIFLTILYWLTLIFKIPLFQSLPGWFWRLEDKGSLDILFVALLFLSTPPLLFLIIERGEKIHRNLSLLILLGFCLQFGFAFLEKRGISAMKDRMVSTGHGEFAHIASLPLSLGEVALNYDDLLRNGTLGRYANSKPPGHLLFYMLIERVSRIFMKRGEENIMERYERLILFSTFFFPFLTYLVLPPLLVLSRSLLPDEPIYPSILYLFIPSVTLITMHLDGALYTTLFLIPFLLFHLALKEESLLLSSLSALSTALAVYTSFSLLSVIPFSLIFGASILYRDLKRGQRAGCIPLIKVSLAFVMVLLLSLFLFKLILNFDVIEGYRRAVSFHREWKHWSPSIFTTAYWAFHNLVEFSVWLGIPVAFLFLTGMLRGLVSLSSSSDSPYPPFAASTLATLLFILLFGTTKGEVARLFLFLVPAVSIVSIRGLKSLFPDRMKHALAVLLFLQVVTSLLLKNFQDFW